MFVTGLGIEAGIWSVGITIHNGRSGGETPFCVDI